MPWGLILVQKINYLTLDEGGFVSYQFHAQIDVKTIEGRLQFATPVVAIHADIEFHVVVIETDPDVLGFAM